MPRTRRIIVESRLLPTKGIMTEATKEACSVWIQCCVEGVEGPARSLSARLAGEYSVRVAGGVVFFGCGRCARGPGRWCRPPPGGPGLPESRLSGWRAGLDTTVRQPGRAPRPRPRRRPRLARGTLGRDFGIRPGSRMPQCTSGVRPTPSESTYAPIGGLRPRH